MSNTATTTATPSAPAQQRGAAPVTIITLPPPRPGLPSAPVAPDDGKIPGYENMSFEQRRYAQDQRAARRAGR